MLWHLLKLKLNLFSLKKLVQLSMNALISRRMGDDAVFKVEFDLIEEDDDKDIFSSFSLLYVVGLLLVLFLLVFVNNDSLLFIRFNIKCFKTIAKKSFLVNEWRKSVSTLFTNEWRYGDSENYELFRNDWLRIMPGEDVFGNALLPVGFVVASQILAKMFFKWAMKCMLIKRNCCDVNKIKSMRFFNDWTFEDVAPDEFIRFYCQWSLTIEKRQIVDKFSFMILYYLIDLFLRLHHFLRHHFPSHFRWRLFQLCRFFHEKRSGFFRWYFLKKHKKIKFFSKFYSLKYPNILYDLSRKIERLINCFKKGFVN